MVFSFAACGKGNTATINNIRFELPEGYSLSRSTEPGSLGENEYEVLDADGQVVLTVGHEDTDWSQFGFTEFDQYFENFIANTDYELVELENAKAVKYAGANAGNPQFESVVVAFVNKDTTVTAYAVLYNEKDAAVAKTFLDALH